MYGGYLFQWTSNSYCIYGTSVHGLAVWGQIVYACLMVECTAASSRWFKVGEGGRGGWGGRGGEREISNRTAGELWGRAERLDVREPVKALMEIIWGLMIIEHMAWVWTRVFSWLCLALIFVFICETNSYLCRMLKLLFFAETCLVPDPSLRRSDGPAIHKMTNAINKCVQLPFL